MGRWGGGSRREEAWCSLHSGAHTVSSCSAFHSSQVVVVAVAAVAVLVVGGLQEETRTDKQVHWPGKMETPAVLSSLIFLICPFLSLLPSLYNTAVLAPH